MKILELQNNFEQVISEAAAVLRTGGMVIYPTETCYGIGVDATKPQAIDKLLAFKTRREGKALSVVMQDQAMAEDYVELNENARNIYRNFLPGPVTVISSLRSQAPISIDPRVVSEFNTLGVRIPNHPVPRALVRELKRPITATSANSSYNPNPYDLAQWQSQTPLSSQNLVDLWLDAGTLPLRQSSTVVDTTRDNLTVMRQGSLLLQGAVQEFDSKSEDDTKEIAARVVNGYSENLKSSGLLIGLQGELGAGKTRFAQGIAESVGIPEHLQSPTFAIMHEYTMPNSMSTLFHIDTWRMESESEFEQLQLRDRVRPGDIVVIEWAEKILNLIEHLAEDLKAPLVWGTVDYIDESTRRWQFSEQRQRKPQTN